MDRDKSGLLRTAFLMALVAFVVTIPAALCYDYLWLGRSPEASFQRWINVAPGIPTGTFLGVLLSDALRRRRVAKSSQSPNVDHTA